MQYGMGAVGPMGTMGPMSSGQVMNSSTGQCLGMQNSSFNMANLISSPQPAQNMPAIQSSQNVTPMQQQTNNTELMRFLTVKFDGVNKRLEKLDTLEKRVNDIDGKVSKLWSDLD